MSHHGELPPLQPPPVTAGSASSPGTIADVERLTGLLDLAAHEMEMPVDRVAARRRLGELRRDRTEGDDDLADLGELVAAVAIGFQMQVYPLGVSTSDAVALVRRQAPMALLRRNHDGTLGWTLLGDHRGRRVLAYDSSGGSEPRWMTVGQLDKLVNERATPAGRWLAMQPLLPCASEAGRHDHHEKPWTRLWRLLAPDRSDIGVILTFAVVIGLLALSSPIAVEALVNTVAFGQLVQPVVVLATILGVFLAFAAAMRAVQTYIAEIIQRRLFVRIAGDLAQRIPRVKSDFWNQHHGPELTNRFFEVVTVQKVATQLLLEGSSLVLQMLVGMAVIAFYHPLLLGFDVFLLLFIIGIIFVLGRGAVDTSVHESRQKYATAAWLEELARFPNSFASRSAAGFAVEQTDRRVTGYLLARMDHFRILMRQVVASLALQVVASTVLLGLGGWLVIRGELSLGQLVAAELIVTVIVGSVAKIGKYLEGYYDVMASMDKLGHLFDMPIERLDGVEAPRGERGMSVQLREVVSPPTLGGARLERASLAIEAGEMVAIVGGSAALRRRLVEVVGMNVEPTTGYVELDGVDARRLCPQSVRDQTALVGSPEIIQGTVAENVHLGRASVGDLDVTGSLQAVGLLEDAMSFPEGLAHAMTTADRSLSNDQAVRLMLARALAGGARLLLLDHCLDGLPDDLLGPLLERLHAVRARCTVVIATGRGEVAGACDRVIEVHDDGRVGSSSPKQLGLDRPAPRRLLTNRPT